MTFDYVSTGHKTFLVETVPGLPIMGSGEEKPLKLDYTTMARPAYGPPPGPPHEEPKFPCPECGAAGRASPGVIPAMWYRKPSREERLSLWPELCPGCANPKGGTR
jgi:hypothetical protein